uniref:Uncharacterized protein n=1 Tax=Anguilla anguilla TaxID=7936 RepID=A0A0E9QEZ1_ANGAN
MEVLMAFLNLITPLLNFTAFHHSICIRRAESSFANIYPSLL